ncbi:MAG: hypothetical protein DMD46_17325 [Gemmatimonadetes bacterium]|nr:MAG: hypothetical protein DMD46_17325 [Gemmatimonadota bacterium]
MTITINSIKRVAERKESSKLAREGCPVAAIGADLPRQPKKVRAVFTERLEEGLAILAALVPAKAASRRRDVAIQCVFRRI